MLDKERRKQIICVSTVVIVGAFVLFCIHGCDGCDDPPQPPTASLLLDSKYLDDHYGIPAAIWCESSADDYLRSVAKWDFGWDEGSKDSRFTQYRTNVKSPGVLTNISHKAKLQNGFGGYQHIALTCDYDTQAKKVVGYEIER